MKKAEYKNILKRLFPVGDEPRKGRRGAKPVLSRAILEIPLREPRLRSCDYPLSDVYEVMMKSWGIGYEGEDALTLELPENAKQRLSECLRNIAIVKEKVCRLSDESGSVRDKFHVFSAGSRVYFLIGTRAAQEVSVVWTERRYRSKQFQIEVIKIIKTCGDKWEMKFAEQLEREMFPPRPESGWAAELRATPPERVVETVLVDSESSKATIRHQTSDIPRKVAASLLPAAPTFYLHRESLFREVEKLFGFSSRRTNGEMLSTLSLYGGAGTGKSTIAAEIGRRAIDANCFTDGVIWIKVGNTSNLIDIQSNLLSEITGVDFAISDVESGLHHLKRESASREFLLILDDVWDIRSVDNLYVKQESSALVLTTRNRQLCVAAESNIVEVGMFDLDESVELISKTIDGVSLPVMPDFEWICQACRGWPIAIAMVANKIKSSPESWGAFLSKLKDVSILDLSAPVKNYEHADLESVVDSVLSTAPSDVKAAAMCLSVFQNSGPLPKSVFRVLWRNEVQKPNDADRLLLELEDIGLISFSSADTVQIHDLVLECIQHLCEDVSLHHEVFCENYLAIGNGGYQGVPVDEYFLTNIINHLCKCRRFTIAESLIFESDYWLSTKRRFFGSDNSYCVDLDQFEDSIARNSSWASVISAAKVSTMRSIIQHRETQLSEFAIGLLVSIGRYKEAIIAATERQYTSEQLAPLIEIYESLKFKHDDTHIHDVRNRIIEIWKISGSEIFAYYKAPVFVTVCCAEAGYFESLFEFLDDYDFDDPTSGFDGVKILIAALENGQDVDRYLKRIQFDSFHYKREGCIDLANLLRLLKEAGNQSTLNEMIPAIQASIESTSYPIARAFQVYELRRACLESGLAREFSKVFGDFVSMLNEIEPVSDDAGESLELGLLLLLNGDRRKARKILVDCTKRLISKRQGDAVWSESFNPEEDFWIDPELPVSIEDLRWLSVCVAEVIDQDAMRFGFRSGTNLSKLVYLLIDIYDNSAFEKGQAQIDVFYPIWSILEIRSDMDLLRHFLRRYEILDLSEPSNNLYETACKSDDFSFEDIEVIEPIIIRNLVRSELLLTGQAFETQLHKDKPDIAIFGKALWALGLNDNFNSSAAHSKFLEAIVLISDLPPNNTSFGWLVSLHQIALELNFDRGCELIHEEMQRQYTIHDSIKSNVPKELLLSTIYRIEGSNSTSRNLLLECVELAKQSQHPLTQTNRLTTMATFLLEVNDLEGVAHVIRQMRKEHVTAFDLDLKLIYQLISEYKFKLAKSIYNEFRGDLRDSDSVNVMLRTGEALSSNDPLVIDNAIAFIDSFISNHCDNSHLLRSCLANRASLLKHRGRFIDYLLATRSISSILNSIVEKGNAPSEENGRYVLTALLEVINLLRVEGDGYAELEKDLQNQIDLY